MSLFFRSQQAELPNDTYYSNKDFGLSDSIAYSQRQAAGLCPSNWQAELH